MFWVLSLVYGFSACASGLPLCSHGVMLVLELTSLMKAWSHSVNPQPLEEDRQSVLSKLVLLGSPLLVSL